jgi:hypothetical protein
MIKEWKKLKNYKRLVFAGCMMVIALLFIDDSLILTIFGIILVAIMIALMAHNLQIMERVYSQDTDSDEDVEEADLKDGLGEYIE